MIKRTQLILSTAVLLFLCYTIVYHHPHATQSLHDGFDKVSDSLSGLTTDAESYDIYQNSVAPTATNIIQHTTYHAASTSTSTTTIDTTTTTTLYLGTATTSSAASPSESADVLDEKLEALHAEKENAKAEEEKEERLDPALYVQAIVSSDNTHFPRLSCPPPKPGRYDYLKADTAAKPKYFFALDLHQSASILPRLLGTVVETMRFLGPTSCELSIVEGRSTDGTPEILRLLKNEIEGMGAGYHFTTSNINPLAGEGTDRIAMLADLRNLALAPLFLHPEDYDPDTTVLFINDIALCMEDLLELVHQKIYQKADMTCAMDWIYNGANFYDVWIGRGMNGDQFFEIAQNGGWEYANNLFWNDGYTKDRLKDGKPFQVFSCWNGVTAFTAKPLLERQIKFRGVQEGECYLGEPVYFCKDLWKLGHGKIAVVPSVNVGYDDEQSHKTKEWRGTVSKWVAEEKADENLIEWKDTPPSQIKCVPTYQAPSWVPWDQ